MFECEVLLSCKQKNIIDSVKLLYITYPEENICVNCIS